ncbi:MAG: histidine kinase [Cellvibrio sp. 79]|nr:MAG: histidine kinase [Cellvibrio sp. 79]
MSTKNTPPTEAITIVGGGPKKVLYTLKTVARIGLLNSAKALNSKNTCKACGLGMGGQRGGMTNEKDEFPSVCNKSIQAQSTDIQLPIPEDLFTHTLEDFKQLSAYELEHLGRLNTPLFKTADTDKYASVTWAFAFDKMAQAFSGTNPEHSFFYSSGRSSNEAGFVLQLLARIYGTNNVNNCSYYCHQATGVGLYNVIGTGTATVSLEDVGNCDCIFVIGANPASNHPRFVHQLKNCRERGGQVIVINPAKEPGLVRFAVPKSAKSMLSGGTWIASEYVQPNIGSDVALLKGIAKALIENQQIDSDFIAQHTDDFYVFKQELENTDWQTIINHCGVTQEKITQLANAYAKSERAIFAWGMGITHHLNGVENVEAIANLALLRGMIGKPAAGLLPLRGHSNVQGIGTVGVKPVLAEDILEKLEQQLDIQLPRTPGMDTLACLQAAVDGKINAALIMGGNLFSATPNTEWARTALDKIPFKVYLTTTLNAGHINGVENSEALVLPVTARDEEWQPTTQESMFNYVRLSDGGIDRLHNVKPEVEILCELGIRLLPAAAYHFQQFKKHNSIRAAIANTIPGMENLKDIAETKQEFTINNRLLDDTVFPTKNQKAQFKSHPLHINTENNKFPFMLASIRSEGQFNSIIYEESDSYRGTDSRWSVLMNNEDMKELGIEAGELVNITSMQGTMTRVKAVGFDLPRGNLMAYYPEANVLIATTHDPRSKTPAFKSVPVKIIKSR